MTVSLKNQEMILQRLLTCPREWTRSSLTSETVTAFFDGFQEDDRQGVLENMKVMESDGLLQLQRANFGDHPFLIFSIEIAPAGLSYFDRKRLKKHDSCVEFWKSFFSQFITGFLSGILVSVIAALILFKLGIGT